MDFRGDPSSALLEVLDPEQNATFNDHYLDLDIDLSEVMFITTANSMSAIPLPLRDRMEIIEIAGYTEFEKVSIAKAHLISKQLRDNGLEGVKVEFTDDAVRTIVHRYTREAGVRNLEREIASVCRKIAKEVVSNEGEPIAFHVGRQEVTRYLGPPRFKDERLEDKDSVGITNGLAWTMFGGVLLTAETTVMPGAGKLIITGKLGDVMQESAQAAMSYVRSRAINLGLAPNFYQKVDLHVHFPEGAAPKDGPSAGITMVTSLVSALTRIPVRRDVAMTGEITLRGRVLPIGGVKEKLMAAHRAGVRTVLIPAENVKDLNDVPRSVRRALEVVPVEHMDEVLQRALVLDDPEAFRERLRQPILPPDVRAAVEPARRERTTDEPRLPPEGMSTTPN
jgi:ATP-dependent Lon protease